MKNFYENINYNKRSNPHYYGYINSNNNKLVYSNDYGLGYDKGFTIVEDCTTYGKWKKHRVSKIDALNFIRKARKEYMSN